MGKRPRPPWPKECCYKKCSSHCSCCASCHHSHCSKYICDTDFSIQLSGLQHGLNFRLRQLLWCKAEFELENAKVINGTIITVGSNFVEVLVSSNKAEKSSVDDLEENLDGDKHNKRKHKKGRTWIFSTDKITSLSPL